MQIKLSERGIECNQKISELIQEMDDYQKIMMCIKALQAVEAESDKFKNTYSQEEYDTVVNTLKNLCSKHEIILPNLDGYVEWRSIEIL